MGIFEDISSGTIPQGSTALRNQGSAENVSLIRKAVGNENMANESSNPFNSSSLPRPAIPPTGRRSFGQA